jgi:ribonucleoside-diphosphate reductase alpha chain
MATITENALDVLKRRYFIKEETTPEQMFGRVAYCVAQAETTQELRDYWEQEFFTSMNDLNWLPNSPTLMNAGTNIKQYSACFVIPIEDSMDNIFDAYKYAALVSKSGGGTGFSFSRLRPKDDKVGSTNGVASGPISWMKIQDIATEQIKQGGKRRGANMGMLRIDHPDILDFIKCKDDGVSLTNFNLSVAITDEFMEAVENGTTFTMRFNGKPYKEVDARWLFNQIVEHAHKTGDPGVVFIDTINRSNPTPHIGEIEATNPCGEQPLLAFEACNLGSINLAKMVKNNEVDWDKLKSVIMIAVRFLDDIIDISEFPVQQVTDIVRGNRKIGLGIMGFADMLCILGISYNSVKAEQLAKKLMLFIQKTSHEYSVELGKEKGVYPNSNGDKKRNAALTTIAPTGTISFIADASGGCEPNFAMVFNRHSPSLNTDYTVVVPVLESRLKELGLYSDELVQKIKANKGQLSGIKEIPKDIQKVFVTATEVSPEWHVRIQAAFQQGVDSAVSKTVNMPSEATIEDVANVYKLAYQLGCKGVTIYRDCSRSSQPLTTGNSASNNNQNENKYTYVKPPMGDAIAHKRKLKGGCGTLTLFLICDENENLCEVWTEASNGGCKANIETISRLTSTNLRANVDPDYICDQLSSAFCKNSWDKTKCKSCGDLIAKEIKRFLEQNKKAEIKEKQVDSNTNMTIDCQHPNMVQSEGCNICPDCGYSKCS